MVEQPSPEHSGGNENASVNWVLVIAAIIVILWVIYSFIQQSVVVESSSRMLSGATREPSETEMPTQMPGMNH